VGCWTPVVCENHTASMGKRRSQSVLAVLKHLVEMAEG